MNCQQFNAALAISIGEALKSCGRGEIDVAQIVGCLELHKSAIISHVEQAQQKTQIIPFRGQIPPNGK